MQSPTMYSSNTDLSQYYSTAAAYPSPLLLYPQPYPLQPSPTEFYYAQALHDSQQQVTELQAQLQDKCAHLDGLQYELQSKYAELQECRKQVDTGEERRALVETDLVAERSELQSKTEAVEALHKTLSEVQIGMEVERQSWQAKVSALQQQVGELHEQLASSRAAEATRFNQLTSDLEQSKAHGEALTRQIDASHQEVLVLRRDLELAHTGTSDAVALHKKQQASLSRQLKELQQTLQRRNAEHQAFKARHSADLECKQKEWHETMSKQGAQLQTKRKEWAEKEQKREQELETCRTTNKKLIHLLRTNEQKLADREMVIWTLRTFEEMVKQEEEEEALTFEHGAQCEEKAECQVRFSKRIHRHLYDLITGHIKCVTNQTHLRTVMREKSAEILKLKQYITSLCEHYHLDSHVTAHLPPSKDMEVIRALKYEEIKSHMEDSLLLTNLMEKQSSMLRFICNHLKCLVKESTSKETVTLIEAMNRKIELLHIETWKHLQLPTDEEQDAALASCATR